MIKLKGLTLKIFIHTFTLIIIVILISLGTLYMILPSYYLKQKNRTFEKNANALETNLNNAKTIDECAAIISNFSKLNNATIIAFDSHDSLIFGLSTPFLLMDDSEKEAIRFAHTFTYTKAPENEKEQRLEGLQIAGGNQTKIRLEKVGSNHESDNVFLYRAEASTNTTRYLKNDLIGHISISSTLQPIDEAKSVIISLIPYLLALDFLIALVAAYIQANQLTKPILKISNAAATMQKMTPGVLSNVRTQDELGQLSTNLDSLYLNLCNNIQNLELEINKVAKMEQSKADFMRAAGHELKTPIAVLNGFLEGMIDNVGPYKNHEKYLLESKDQVASLAKLVNEILVSSQMEHIDDLITFEDIDVSDILRETVAIYKTIIEKKRIDFTEDIFSFKYYTDAHMLMKALSNLISNAVNYTQPKGEINISFVEGINESVLSIENQCKNIDNELLQELFEPFFTLNYNRSKANSGTGLGLYIVKKNLNALNLPFKIENTKVGLKFSIIFPNTDCVVFM